ncbi:hypothetical protein QL285_009669 [Trifolium repens]|jgi:hypothetical protein|nr:hypothetical protein QL285_009669 [Trifolium repens]
MEKKGASAGIATKFKSQRGKKISESSVSKPRRVSKPRKSKAKSVPAPSVSSDSYSPDEDYVEFLKTYKSHDGYSSGSDEIDEDYAEFLKTYVPEESYSDEVQVQCEGVLQEKKVSAPSKTAADFK